MLTSNSQTGYKFTQYIFKKPIIKWLKKVLEDNYDEKYLHQLAKVSEARPDVAAYVAFCGKVDGLDTDYKIITDPRYKKIGVTFSNKFTKGFMPYQN